MQLTQGKTHSNLEKDNADNFGYKEILSNESIQQTIVDKKSMCYISFTKYKQMWKQACRFRLPRLQSEMSRHAYLMNVAWMHAYITIVIIVIFVKRL